ncbi:LysR family transcriptional regulator [Roseomonas sp. M0104]|uniref:LysR family transcriptional regulator n=1 Tax=Teichococcus coralli TaxID=2545983 RepID=A0A845BGG4_9PROT|nr:LysR family transcriptional regulator [Pseudoroseomonas coralli]MXP66095.1 LysR family transcriptional regulator [Pseudoroseomonas coralli]
MAGGQGYAGAPLLDWDDLRFFLAIVRTGSLSAAARELRVTQSTVGRRLASLEGGLGARLLHRTPEGYVPTLAGEAILGQAERVEAEALAVERTVGGRDAQLEGVVRVTSVETLASHVLAPAFCALQLGNPEIGIELLANVRHMSLAMREADIAVRLTRFEQHDLVARRIGTMAHGLYASRSYLERHGRPDFTDGCSGHLLVTGLDGTEVPQLAGWLAEIAPRATVALRTDSPEAQLQATLCGRGMACLPRLRADTWEDELQRLRPPMALPGAEIWLAVHKDNRRTPRIRLALDVVANAVRDLAGRLDPPESLQPPGPPA